MSNEEKLARLKETIDLWKGKEGALMPVMHEAQELFGCLEESTQEFIAQHLGVLKSQVYGVATFYSRFTVQPRRKYIISQCLGTACYVRGAQDVYDEFAKQLGIGPGETTEDGLFTLESARCIGCCGLAPALMVNDEVFGRLTPGDVAGILDKYRALG